MLAKRLLSRKFFGCVSSFSHYSTATKSEGNLVLVDVNDKTGFATLTLNRPPVNSFNTEFLREISKTLDELENNKSRGVILTSTIPTIFSAGLDINNLLNPNEDYLKELWTEAQGCWLKLFGSSFPIAAALNGHTLAGGCFYALSCEYRVMVENYKIGINEILVGVTVPRIIVNLMKTLIEAKESERSLLFGTIYSSQDALKIGLIDELASDKNDAIAKCEAYLNKFKGVPPQARNNTKQISRQSLLDYMRTQRQKDLEEFVASVMNDEAQTVIKKYLESLKKKKNK